MRILIATYYYLPHVGGGTWYPYHLARQLAGKGHEVTLLAPRILVGLASTDPLREESSGVEEVRLNEVPLPSWFAAFVGLLLFHPRIIRKARAADVLFGQYHPHHTIPFAIVLLGKLVRRPVVLRVEDWRRWMYGAHPSVRARVEYALSGPVNALNEWGARRADSLLVVNSLGIRYLESKGRRGQPIKVSSNGLDLEAIRSLPDRTTLRGRLGIPQEAKVLVFVGRSSGPEYRIEVLLRAFRNVLRERPEAVLVLVGDDSNSILRSTHDDLIQKGALRIIGPVPQETAVSYAALADVAIGPLGPTEASPLKVLEAVAVGTPVVAGEGSLGPELSGFAVLVDQVPSSPASVAKAILERLQSPRPATSEAFQRLVSPFGWVEIASQVESELERIARENEK
jgi:glycosyltransferase involved in cell wall biosynthesis